MLPLSVNVGQPISHRLDHLLSGVRAEIALKIFGDDLDTLRHSAENSAQRLAKIPGLADLQVEKQVRIPQLEIRVDYTARRALRRAAGAVTDADRRGCRTGASSRTWSTATGASTS